MVHIRKVVIDFIKNALKDEREPSIDGLTFRVGSEIKTITFEQAEQLIECIDKIEKIVG